MKKVRLNKLYDYETEEESSENDGDNDEDYQPASKKNLL